MNGSSTAFGPFLLRTLLTLLALVIPQGYTLSMAGSFAVAVHRNGFPGDFGAWGFVVGAVVAFVALAMLSHMGQGGWVAKFPTGLGALLKVGGRRRRALGVQPMSAAPNAFETGDGLRTLQPDEGSSSTCAITCRPKRHANEFRANGGREASRQAGCGSLGRAVEQRRFGGPGSWRTWTVRSRDAAPQEPLAVT